jgi:mRNA interferase RelE/StbE
LEIRYKASVAKDLKKIGREDRNRILSKIERDLIQDPDRGEKLKGKFKGLLKYRVGDYRIIYTKIPDGILILRIWHRRRIYEK